MPEVRRKAQVLALILGLMTYCPLVFAGLMPQSLSATDTGEMHAAQFGVYISNPSPFSFSTSRLQLWQKDGQDAKTAHEVPEAIPKTSIPAHTSPASAVLVKFSDDSLILNNYVGVTVECDGLG